MAISGWPDLCPGWIKVRYYLYWYMTNADLISSNMTTEIIVRTACIGLTDSLMSPCSVLSLDHRIVLSWFWVDDVVSQWSNTRPFYDE